jgi:O-acetyl-ADP-ribose deacetylase (regulator of RNase III)
MPIIHRKGDLFASTDLDALAHGCNCRGLMGAGIATQFSRRWPVMYERYRQLCRSGQYKVGDCFAWQAQDGLTIYNLASQDRPGRDARLDAIESSARRMIEHAQANGIRRIGLPQIGAGIGGLAWADVERSLERAIADSPVELIVHTL